MIQRYTTREDLNEAIIALGSNKPVKAFAKVKFGENGDIYWIEDLKRDVDATNSHLSIHKTGEIRQTTGSRRRGFDWSSAAPPITKASVREVLSGSVRFDEDFFYEGLPTLKKPKRRGKFVACLYPKVVGATLRYTIDLVNGLEESHVDRAIGDRLTSDNPRGDVLIFIHQGRILVVCLEFSGGMSTVDESKLREVDSLDLTHVKVCLFDSLSLG